MSNTNKLFEAFKRSPGDISRRLVEMAIYNGTRAGQRKRFSDALDASLDDPFYDVELSAEARAEEPGDIFAACEVALKAANENAVNGDIVATLHRLLACSEAFPAAPENPEDQKTITAAKVQSAIWGAYANTVMPMQIMNNRNTVFMINLALRMRLDVEIGERGTGGILNMKLHPRGATLVVPAMEEGQSTPQYAADVKAAAMRAVYAFAFSHRERIEESEWAQQEGADATASMLVSNALISAMGGGAETFGVGGCSISESSFQDMAREIMSNMPGVAEAGDVTSMSREYLGKHPDNMDLSGLYERAGDLIARHVAKRSPNGMSPADVRSYRNAAASNLRSGDIDIVSGDDGVREVINGLSDEEAEHRSVGTLAQLHEMITTTMGAFGRSYQIGRDNGGRAPAILTFKLDVKPGQTPEDPPVVTAQPIIIKPSFDSASAWARNLITANEKAGGAGGEGDKGATNDLLKQLAQLGQDPNPNGQSAMSEDDKNAEMEGGKYAGQGFREVMRMLDLEDEYGGKLDQNDWIELLNRALIKAMGFERHLTWTKPNRRFAAQSDIYMPGFKREKPGRIAICIDESGSIDEEQLKKFGSEMCRALEVVSPQGVDILHFSHELRIEQLEQGQMWEPKRWLDGGTNFQQCYDWLNEAHVNGANYDAILFFTDLYGESGCLDKDRRPLPDTPFIWITYATRHKTEYGAHIDIQTGEISGDSLESAD